MVPGIEETSFPWRWTLANGSSVCVQPILAAFLLTDSKHFQIMPNISGWNLKLFCLSFKTQVRAPEIWVTNTSKREVTFTLYIWSCSFFCHFLNLLSFNFSGRFLRNIRHGFCPSKHEYVTIFAIPVLILSEKVQDFRVIFVPVNNKDSRVLNSLVLNYPAALYCTYLDF